MLSVIVNAPPLLAMPPALPRLPPPLYVAVLLAMVLSITLTVPKLQIPAPAAAVLFETVLSISVSIPEELL